MVRKNKYGNEEKKYVLLTPKPNQMMNVNVKVNVKVTNVHFQKRRKNSNLVIF